MTWHRFEMRGTPIGWREAWSLQRCWDADFSAPFNTAPVASNPTGSSQPGILNFVTARTSTTRTATMMMARKPENPIEPPYLEVRVFTGHMQFNDASPEFNFDRK